ncbi:hypothetical protein RHGRI_016838 [Rhododendron griersonianum]|uniref:SecA Wing/Scaffold domain-containing protein n=1 Tax=Rhododendron griersonianum TaxID=479676 RepID=A0AAV6JVM2_9ERIC|nr:hypothetical protein RHGRI_016838 [Rhododendron griersonianum]
MQAVVDEMIFGNVDPLKILCVIIISTKYKPSSNGSSTESFVAITDKALLKSLAQLQRDGKYKGTANILRKYLGDYLIASYLDVVQESGYDDAYVKEIERAVLVKTLDCFWRDHLVNMNRLSSAVNVRSFGQRNPLEEYKIDGCRFFISMLSATQRLTVESLLRYWSSPMESQELYIP